MPMHFNISEEVLRKCLHDSVQANLIAFSLMVKNKYVSGCIHDVSVRKLMREFHLGNSTARKMIEFAKRSELFSYDEERNRLTALNFNKAYTQTKTDKYGRTIYCLPSFLIDTNAITTLQQTRLAIRKVVMDSAIYRKLVDKSSSTKKGNYATKPTSVSTSYLGTIIGVSKSSVSRYLKAEVCAQKLTKTGFKVLVQKKEKGKATPPRHIDMHLVRQSEEEDIYIRFPEYGVADQAIARYWRHLILNARCRITKRCRKPRLSSRGEKRIQEQQEAHPELVAYGCEFYANGLIAMPEAENSYWSKFC